MTNQRNGDQRQALFDAIFAYGSNIDNLPALLPAVERIAHKHASFNIQPAQYAIVGKHLLATLDEMLNPGKHVLDAWGKAYGVLADVFIQRESHLYHESAMQAGGWQGTRQFRIAEKQQQSSEISSFILEPVDGLPVIDYRPGQYLGLYIRHPQWQHQEIRQYSLTHTPNGKNYRIAVKRQTQGLVSNYLHQEAKVGSLVSLAAPHGDFVLHVPNDTTPITFISAGVGQTPLLAMLDSLVASQHQGPVYWLHATENSHAHAFAKEAEALGNALPHWQQHIWYRLQDEGDQQGNHAKHQGLIDLKLLHQQLASPSMQIYLCGPIQFMQYAAQQLQQIGCQPQQIHYECFGPHKIM